MYLSGELLNGFYHLHPFYVSVTEINHNAKGKILEISCKIFTNDFEAALEKYSGNKVDLTDPAQNPASGKSIAEYISKHLQLRVDNHPVILQYVGSEHETDATWSYFQVSEVPSVKKLEIIDDLLYESFETEINIIHVTVNAVRQSTKLNNPEKNASFNF
ncbi:MAG: DUF6702 family protein [Chitinophagales bacterium]